jgi:hypothetical protein
MTKLEIRTRLHEGIYAHERESTLQQREPTYTLSVPGLRDCVRQLPRRRAHMERCYGKIGAGISWVQTTTGINIMHVLPMHAPSHVDEADVQLIERWVSLSDEQRQAEMAAHERYLDRVLGCSEMEA